MKAEFRAGVLSVSCKKGQREKPGERTICLRALFFEPFIELIIKKKKSILPRIMGASGVTTVLCLLGLTRKNY